MSPRTDKPIENRGSPVPGTSPPKSYLLSFLAVFVIAELSLVGLDLYYVVAQGDTAADFWFDFLVVSTIIVFLVLLAYFVVRRMLVRVISSERRFHDLADSLPEGVFEADATGVMLYANIVGLDWFGYTPNEIAGGGMHVLDVVVPQDRQRAAEDMARLLAGDVDTPRIYNVKKRDGTSFPVQVTATPIRRQGKITGLRGVMTNISEQKKAEAIIRLSEKKYRELADSLPEVVFETDVGGNITYVNANAWSTFGYSEEALDKGLNVRALMADPDSSMADIELMIRTRTPAVSREYTVLRGDGTPFPVVISARLVVEDGEPVGIRGIITDVTEMKVAQQKVRESEEKYRSLFESSLDGIEVVDLKSGHIVEANQSLLDMFGYTMDELLEKGYFELTPADWLNTEAVILRDQVFERGHSDEYEKEIYRKDGTIVPVSIRRWLIRDEAGQPVAMWSILRDITEKKLRDKELERVNAELRGYAHTVSHDLKNPIHEVSFSCHTLDMLMDREDTEENRGYIAQVLEVMKHGLDRANDLIEGILALAESGQVPQDVAPVDVGAKLDEVLSERAMEMEMRGIKVVRDEDLGVVQASPTHIYQVFSNLIKNAFEHCDNDWPVVEVRAVGESGGSHRYLVRDNGSGIPPEIMDTIFVPFSRGDSGQTGIGLSIVERITRVYAGDIKAYNDSGACFEFSLRDFE